VAGTALGGGRAVARKWRRDLRPLRPEDAVVLRRYAEMLDRRHPKQGFAADVANGIIAKLVRDTADRLEAGELDARQ
jgi:hypothetical protein